MKVNVLGTDYTIIKRKYEVDKNFKEMIDWIAIQGEKIYAAWKSAGCI